MTPPPDATATAPAEGISYVAELRRKALHLTALGFPVGIILVRRPTALVILFAMAAFAVVLDVTRQKVPAVRGPFLRVFGGLMRPEEIPAEGRPVADRTIHHTPVEGRNTAMSALLSPS